MQEKRICKGSVVHTIEKINIIHCTECGFKHVDPLPAFEELKAFYGGAYYEEEKPEMLAGYWKNIDWFNQVYDERLSFFEGKVNNKTVLDVGAGAGFFLRRAKEKGWNICGVEPSKSACCYAKEQHQIEISNGFFEMVDFDARKFHLIHLSEVLEHTLDPTAILLRAYDMLDPNGWVAIVVPNDFNPLQKVFIKISQRQPHWIVPTHHYNYFEKDTLSSLLEKTGFVVGHVETSFPMEMFLLAGLDYTTNPNTLGRTLHNYVKILETNLAIHGEKNMKRGLYEKLSELNIGRDLIIYAKKRND